MFVCVRWECVALRKRPRQFQISAALARAMFGWETAATQNLPLHPSPPLPKHAQGQCARSVKLPPAHTDTHHVFSSLPATGTSTVKSGIGMEVKSSVRSGEAKVKCQHDIPICRHGNPKMNLQANTI